MVTVHRAHGLRFVIYLDDHEPAHVHVIGDGEAKIQLVGEKGTPQLIWSQGFARGDLRRAMAVISESRDEFLRHWREIHG